ncbi:hypothetical protein Tco_1303254, partial [Tanacetum coccineum]
MLIKTTSGVSRQRQNVAASNEILEASLKRRRQEFCDVIVGAVVCAQLNENRTNKRLKIVGSVVGAGVNVGVDCCGRGVIDGIVGGMVGAAAVHVSEITVT